MKVYYFVLFIILSTTFCAGQERPRPNFVSESLNFDSLYIHFQQNFMDDRVVLFANGVRIFDGILYSSITKGRAKDVIKLPYLSDTISFVYIFFEKDHHWSLEEEPIFFQSKKLEFKVVPKNEGKYLGLFIFWDDEKGSIYDEKSKRAINMVQGYLMSKDPFMYY